MNASSVLRRIAGPIILASALCASASATVVLDITSVLTAGDPTQSGRLFRGALPQDWAGSEAFPGISTFGTIYHYQTFVIDLSQVALGPFFQISIDHLGPNQGTLFASAYVTSYLPNSTASGNRGFDTNWLGDAGSSGNFFGGLDPAFFQATGGAGTLVVVVNNVFDGTGAGSGIGEQFRLIVESFSDTEYTDAATPNPQTSVPDFANSALLLGLGLAGLTVVRRIAVKRGL